MRICVLSAPTQVTPSPVGGLETMTHFVATELLKRGHDVTLIAKPGSQFLGKLITVQADGYEGEARFAATAFAMYQQWPFDVIYDHTHTHHLARLFPNLPVVNHYHDRFQTLERCAILCSEGQRAQMGFAAQDARIIHHALYADAYRAADEPDSKDDYVLWMGWWSDLKQPMLAIEACARAGVKLIMAGMKPDEMTFAGSSVQHVGVVTGEQKHALFRRARLFLQLGTDESFGLTTLEANLLGTPVVAWPAGGSLDLIEHGTNGVFIPPYGNKVQAVADTIQRGWNLDSKTARDYAVEHFTEVHGCIAQIESSLADCMRGDFW